MGRRTINGSVLHKCDCDGVRWCSLSQSLTKNNRIHFNAFLELYARTGYNLQTMFVPMTIDHWYTYI